MPTELPESNYETKVLNWAMDAIQEGEAMVRAQYGYTKIQQTIEAVMGDLAVSPRPSDLSQTTANHISKICLDLSSGLTDTKPFWEFKTRNTKWQQNATNLNKLAEHWWTQRYIDLRFMDVIKYSLVGGTGYAHLQYNAETQDLDMLPEDTRDVIPIRPSSYLSLQDAFGVVIRRERTVNYLRQLYPSKADRIKADRDGSLAEVERAARMRRFLNVQAGAASPFSNYLFGRKPMQDITRIPTVDFFIMYIKDASINKESHDVQMGDPDANWSYVVKRGEPLYPRGRCIEFTRTTVLYDGPNPYWHGLFPVAKLTLDPYPWTWLGKAPMWDLLPLQKALDNLLRVVDDHNQKVAAPDLIAHKNVVAQKAMQKIDTRRAGLKLKVNPISGKPVEFVYPEPLDASIKDSIEFYISEMNTLSGVTDLTQMSKLGQIPSSETVEKILEAMTPAVRLRSRVIEIFMRDFARMVASNFMQFYPPTLVTEYLGPQSITPEEMDSDPGTIVPDYINLDDYTPAGDIKPEAILKGPRPRYDRAKEYLKYFSYDIAQGSLLNASSVTKKLLYLQLARAGLIDNWTLLETLDIPNVGEPPGGASTITDRLAAQQQMQLQAQVNPVGRKATAQTMPSMNSKGGIVES